MDDCKNDGLNSDVSNLNQDSNQSPTEFDPSDKIDSEHNFDSVSQSNTDLNKKESISSDDENKQQNKESTLDENKNNIEGDEISDEENFKDDELDFEEGENSRSNEDSNKVASEDGEVDTEEELEDGEVKEDDEDDEDLDKKQANASSTNLGNVCRFYSKGLCTWGPNCRFVHQKPPIGFNIKNSQNNNQRQNNVNKTNDNSLNQNKNINYQTYINKHLNANNNTVSSNNQYNQNTSLDNQWDRGNKFNKKDNFNKVNYRSDEGDFDIQASQQPLPQQKNKYNPEDRTSTANYSRNVPYYNNQKNNSQANQAVTNYRPRNPTAQHTETSSFESEYERKRRLAFESAPWNENEATSPTGIREPSLERNSQFNKSYKSHVPNYVKKNENAEHFRDPWRRSKSPLQFSRSTSQQMYQKSRSDSGSNFSNSDSEMIEISHKKRLDPHFANKHRPSSFRESSNGELPFSNSYDNQRLELDSPPPTSSSKYYNKSQDLENNIASSYSASTSTFAKSNEMDVPNYERPKNLPPRSRKDSWSDSDSSCSSSSYSGTGSDSDSNSDNEPYSRTNKFESTREVSKIKNDDVFMINEPQNKKQRISDHSRIKNDINKPRSPYSPADSPSKYSSLSRYASSDRKKQSVMNCDVGSPYVEDSIGTKERSSQKKLKSNRFEQMDRNNGSGKHNENDNGDPKKTELLQQLKAIEEAIARKRSKLK